MSYALYNFQSKKYSLTPGVDAVGSFIKKENGVKEYFLNIAITDGVTVTTAVDGSFAITSHAIGIGKVFTAVSGVWESTSGTSGGITGTGTTNRFPYFTDADSLGDSHLRYHSTNFAGRTTFDNSTYDAWYLYHEADIFGGSNYDTLSVGNGRNYIRFDAFQTQDATHGNIYEQFVYDGLKQNYVGFSMNAYTSADVYMWQWARHNIVAYTDKFDWNNFFGGSQFTMSFVPDTTNGRWRVGDYTTTPTNYIDLNQALNQLILSATTISLLGNITFNKTITPGGTTGTQVINKTSGSVNIATGQSDIIVTNNLVTSDSLVMAMVQTNDGTAIVKNVVPTNGSFTINMNAAVTGETRVAFWVTN